MTLALAVALAACKPPAPAEPAAEAKSLRQEVVLADGGSVVIRQEGAELNLAVFSEDGELIVNQFVGEHPLGRDWPAGNRLLLVLKDETEGQIRVRRNSRDQDMRRKDWNSLDRASYEDSDGNGIVDYRRDGRGVYRVARIEWEKVADLPAVPPDHPSERVDVDLPAPAGTGG